MHINVVPSRAAVSIPLLQPILASGLQCRTGLLQRSRSTEISCRRIERAPPLIGGFFAGLENRAGAAGELRRHRLHPLQEWIAGNVTGQRGVDIEPAISLDRRRRRSCRVTDAFVESVEGPTAG